MKHYFLFAVLLISSLFCSVAQAAGEGKVQPQGTPQWYALNCWLQTSSGTVYYTGLSTQISFSDDGKHVYFKTLFPAQYEELWVEGTIIGNTVTIDKNATLTTESFTDDSGRRWSYDLKVGEPVFDASKNIVDVKNVQFVLSDNRIYINDDLEKPNHPIALYGVDEEGVQLFDWTFCDDFKPYTGPTEPVAVPEKAVVKSYIYDYLDLNLNPTTTIGHVAVDGNDYYFDSLIPDVKGWLKGTRSGNQITIAQKQLISFSPIILRGAGYLQSDGGYLSDLKFSIDAKGNIKQDNDFQFVVSYLTSGSLYSYGRQYTLTPYEEDSAFEPSEPFEVHAVYYDELGQHGIEFYQRNTATDGSLLNADQLGYYIYVDGERFTFRRSQYPYIKSDTMTFVPFGYCDDYYLGDIFCDGIYNCVLFYFDDYQTLGVQSVYRAGDVETRSGIVTVNKYGNMEIIPDGINELETAPTAPASWYDLCGRKASAPAHGIFIKDGKKTILK